MIQSGWGSTKSFEEQFHGHSIFLAASFINTVSLGVCQFYDSIDSLMELVVSDIAMILWIQT